MYIIRWRYLKNVDSWHTDYFLSHAEMVKEYRFMVQNDHDPHVYICNEFTVET